MTDSISEDSVTKLNTQLNKSMILMEDAVDTKPKNNKRKSITINTKTQPSGAIKTPAIKSRKSILKKSDKSLNKDSVNNEVGMNGSVEESSNVSAPKLSSSASNPSRPRTVRESLILFEKLTNICTWKLYLFIYFFIASRNSQERKFRRRKCILHV